jgi:hypothetical protein
VVWGVYFVSFVEYEEHGFLEICDFGQKLNPKPGCSEGAEGTLVRFGESGLQAFCDEGFQPAVQARFYLT